MGGLVRNIKNDRHSANTIILPAGQLATVLTMALRTYGVRLSAKF